MTLLNMPVNLVRLFGLFICAFIFGIPQVSQGQNYLVSQWAFSPPTSSGAVAFSPNGAFIAVGSGNSACVYSVSTQLPFQGILLKLGDVQSLQFSPDGQTLAIAEGTSESSAGIEFWNVKTGKFLGRVISSASEILSMTFLPDGQKLATGGDLYGGAGVLEMWNVSGHNLSRRLKTKATSVTSVAFSHDGKLLAAGGENGNVGSLELWNSYAGTLEKSLAVADLTTVYSVVFSPDRTTVSCSGRTSSGSAVVSWTIQSGILKSELKGNLPNGVATLSPDATHIATSQIAKSTVMGQYYQSTSVELWDVTKLQTPVTEWTAGWNIGQIVFSPDASMVATTESIYSWWGQGMSGAFENSGGQCAIWKTAFPYASNEIVMTAFSQWPVGSPLRPTFSPDGKLVVGGAPNVGQDNNSQSAFVTVWNSATGNCAVSLPTTATNGSLITAFSQDDKWLALTGAETGVDLYDIKSGILVKSLGSGLYAAQLVFLPTRSLLAIAGNTGSGNDVVQLWDFSTGKLIETFTTSSNAGINGLALTTDGSRLIVGGSYNSGVSGQVPQGVLEIWDVNSGTRSAELSTDESDVYGVTLSPDEKSLVAVGLAQASTSVAQVCRLENWNLSSKKLVSTLPLYDGTTFVYAAWFSENGSLLYVSTYGGPSSIQVVDFANNKLAGYLNEPYFGSVALSPNATLAAVTSPNYGLTVSTVPLIKSAQIKSLSFSSDSLVEGETTTATITLNQPAPTGGITVGLEMTLPLYSDPSLPSTISIPAGKTTATFTMQAPFAYGVTQYTLTAISGSYTISANLTVVPSG